MSSVERVREKVSLRMVGNTINKLVDLGMVRMAVCHGLPHFFNTPRAGFPSRHLFLHVATATMVKVSSIPYGKWHARTDPTLFAKRHQCCTKLLFVGWKHSTVANKLNNHFNLDSW